LTHIVIVCLRYKHHSATVQNAEIVHSTTAMYR